jgi:thiamine-phosphate pyrophosphorylase
VKSFAECLLYTFVDTAYLRGRAPTEVAQQLCQGGSDVIQLRAKNCVPEEIRRIGQSILPITERFGVGLVINDFPQIARQVGAVACHLGQEDFFQGGFTQAAQLTGCPPDLKLGLSTHAPGQAERAVRAGPDYIAIGPVYATGTKPSAPPTGLEYVRWAAGHVSIPWFAIGGINLQNLDEVMQAGAKRVCVVSAILNAPDVVGACQAFKKRLTSAA